METMEHAALIGAPQGLVNAMHGTCPFKPNTFSM
jgi:hypothetical protein